MNRCAKMHQNSCSLTQRENVLDFLLPTEKSKYRYTLTALKDSDSTFWKLLHLILFGTISIGEDPYTGRKNIFSHSEYFPKDFENQVKRPQNCYQNFQYFDFQALSTSCCSKNPCIFENRLVFSKSMKCSGLAVT